jgi:membrane protein DedA with SNARE-associated domain
MDIFSYISLHNLDNWVYVVLFFGMFIDANLSILFSVFLFSQSSHAFSAVIFLPVILGGFVEQFALVYLGEKLQKNDRLAGWANKLTSKFDAHLQNNVFRSLLLSKFIIGLHRAVLIRMGMLGIKWKVFAKATLKSTFIWLLTVGILGFIFSESYKALSKYFEYTGFLLLFVFIIFFILEFFISRRLKKDI